MLQKNQNNTEADMADIALFETTSESKEGFPCMRSNWMQDIRRLRRKRTRLFILQCEDESETIQLYLEQAMVQCENIKVFLRSQNESDKINRFLSKIYDEGKMIEKFLRKVYDERTRIKQLLRQVYDERIGKFLREHEGESVRSKLPSLIPPLTQDESGTSEWPSIIPPPPTQDDSVTSKLPSLIPPPTQDDSERIEQFLRLRSKRMEEFVRDFEDQMVLTELIWHESVLQWDVFKFVLRQPLVEVERERIEQLLHQPLDELERMEKFLYPRRKWFKAFMHRLSRDRSERFEKFLLQSHDESVRIEKFLRLAERESMEVLLHESRDRSEKIVQFLFQSRDESERIKEFLLLDERLRLEVSFLIPPLDPHQYESLWDIQIRPIIQSLPLPFGNWISRFVL